MLTKRFAVAVMLALGMGTARLSAQTLDPSALLPCKINFAIPDAPAFELLELEPSTILRPQTARELTLAFSQFNVEAGTLNIPRAFALEFSPGLLISSRDLQVEDYKKQKLLYSLRFSAAALRDSIGTGPSRLAVGIRFTFADETDFKTDSEYAKGQQVTALTEQINEVYVQARRRIGKPDSNNSQSKPIKLLPDEEKQIAQVQKKIRDRWAERYWNADILEVALAGRAQTADSTGRNPQLDAFALWGSYAKGLGNWGQVLFGVKLGTQRDSLDGDFFQQTSFAGRLYVGSNRYKGFVEVQQSWREKSEATLLFNSGFELAINEWIWANFSAGIEDKGNGKGASAVTSFKLKTGLPRL